MSSLTKSLIVKCFFRVLSSSGKMLPKDAILGDVLMSGNQIPTFLLKDIFSKTCCEVEKYLQNLFVEFCGKIWPIKVEWPECPLKLLEHHHLLDLLYQYITYKKDSKETKKNFSTKTTVADSARDLEAAKGPQECSLFSQLRDNMAIFQNLGRVKIFLLILELFLGIVGVFGVTVEILSGERKC
ncbi:hypothetical protein SLE2022_033290 [Rubroshorea leprosula]